MIKRQTVEYQSATKIANEPMWLVKIHMNNMKDVVAPTGTVLRKFC